MMTVRQALVAASCVLLVGVGCGVGPYHIPNVEPVVKPPPEEDIFAELGMESESPTAGGTEEAKPDEAKPEEKAEPGAAEKPDDKAAEPKDKAAEPKAAAEPPPAEKKPAEKKPAEKKPDAKKK